MNPENYRKTDMPRVILQYTSEKGVKTHLNLNLVEHFSVTERNGASKVWARTCSGWEHTLHTFDGEESEKQADHLIARILQLPAEGIVHVDDLVNPAPAPKRVVKRLR